ncbi:MAG: hypothetical protein M3362_21655, partial [Acidobacteriota bacterium]|nr:hypothetical protein [Acidobacteriota bacterium]
MAEERRRTDGGEEAVCFRCLAVNSGAEAFCRECGAPVGGSATLDPVQTIRAQGFMYRRALEGRPKLIVLVGVWILHLPVLA